MTGAARGLLAVWTMMLAATSGAAPALAQQPSIEGTWRIATPSASLRPMSGAAPLNGAGRKLYEEHRRKLAQKTFDYDYTQSRCASPGLPRLLLTPMRFRIWNRPEMVTFQYEWNRLYWQADLDNLGPRTEDFGSEVGYSSARWQGDTLVVDTRDFTDGRLLDNLLPRSDRAKLTTRYRLVDADTLEARVTIDDPTYYTRPWQAAVTYARQPDTAFEEDVCLDRRDAGELPLPLE